MPVWTPLTVVTSRSATSLVGTGFCAGDVVGVVGNVSVDGLVVGVVSTVPPPSPPVATEPTGSNGSRRLSSSKLPFGSSGSRGAVVVVVAPPAGWAATAGRGAARRGRGVVALQEHLVHEQGGDQRAGDAEEDATAGAAAARAPFATRSRHLRYLRSWSRWPGPSSCWSTRPVSSSEWSCPASSPSPSPVRHG